MDLEFERGSGDEPRGHALLYFREPGGGREIVATYLVIPPVPLNLSRYMPPLLSGNVSPAEMQQVSGVPLPPVPERMESYAAVKHLADLRDDDLIFGGTLDPQDMQRGLMLAGEAAQRYYSLYSDFHARAAAPAESQEEEHADVSEVIYGLMSERQRLGELAKLTGQLRYALDGNDLRLVRDTVREMEVVGHLVPEKYRVADLIAAAQTAGPRGQRLSQLFLDRCYRLADEDYTSLKQIEEEIRSLQAGEE